MTRCTIHATCASYLLVSAQSTVISTAEHHMHPHITRASTTYQAHNTYQHRSDATCCLAMSRRADACTCASVCPIMSRLLLLGVLVCCLVSTCTSQQLPSNPFTATRTFPRLVSSYPFTLPAVSSTPATSTSSVRATRPVLSSGCRVALESWNLSLIHI